MVPSKSKLLIINELDYVPISQTGAELLFKIFSKVNELGSTVVTSNLPFRRIHHAKINNHHTETERLAAGTLVGTELLKVGPDDVPHRL